MKRNKITVFLLAIALLVMLAGCGQATDKPENTTAPEATAAATAEATEQADTSITVSDMTGREIKLDAPAEKIVAITASDCEILYAVGAGDKLVGRGEFCDYPEEVLSVTSVNSGDDTNIEQIIALGPQVVLMSTMAQTEEQIAALENAGIKVVVTDAKTIDEVYTAIELIGTIVGKDAEAAAVIDSMKATFDEVSAKATGDGTKTIYFEVSPLEYGLWTAGSGTFLDEMATMLGLKNIFADVEGWGEVSQEQVIERNPDFIVTSTMAYGDGPTPIEEIMGREGWKDITALKNGAVMNADSNEVVRPGPRLANAIKVLYSFVYEGEIPSAS